MASQVTDLLCELVAVPSVNPRLATAVDRAPGERELTDWLVRFMRDAGWPAALQRVHPGRCNVLAALPGERGDVLLWEVHQDTVSASGMTVEPFAATVRDGRLYGRGACDVKGGMAAMLAALVHAAAEPPTRRPTILLACTVNEECGFTGACELARLWSADAATADATVVDPIGLDGLTLARLRAMRPVAALVAEPTDLNVVVAHRGVVRWQSTVHGRAAHSSRPENGANAVYAMARVVGAIDEFHRVELAARPADPLCGPPTACVTTIRGGVGANTVPDRAVIDVDRRLRPDEIPAAAYQELIAYLAERVELGACRLEHDPPWMQSRGLTAGENRPWAEQLAAVARSVGAPARLVGVPYGADAASIAAAGIPAAVFGPGSITQAHTADEWIALDELERAAEAYYRLASGAIATE